MLSWTSRRDPAQQTWPWLKKMPLMMPSTAWSMRGVFEDDVGGFSAEFEGELFAGAGEGALDEFADLGGTGEGDFSGERVIDDGGTGFTGTGDDIDDARRAVRLPEGWRRT